jgi:hypothetical protein
VKIAHRFPLDVRQCVKDWGNHPIAQAKRLRLFGNIILVAPQINGLVKGG